MSLGTKLPHALSNALCMIYVSQKSNALINLLLNVDWIDLAEDKGVCQH